MSQAKDGEREARVARVSHIQINCSDFRRSVAFYQLLGFEVERIISDDPDTPTDLRDLDTVPLREGPWGANYTVGLGLGDDPRAMTKLELIQWERPRKTAPAQHPKDGLGVARVAFTVRGLDTLLTRLREHGHAVEEVQSFEISPTLTSKFAHIHDPDGSWLTLTEWVRAR